MDKPNIQQMQKDFKALQEWVQERIFYYIKDHDPVYSQASLAKAIGIGAKTVLFALELSDNMSYRKWMELAQGIIKLENDRK